jgi:hypothetical protein
VTIRIGIDFDNTIANYDRLFSAVAKKLKINLDKYPLKKELIKKEIFKNKNGLRIWQKLQGKVYGEFISGAKIFEGVRKFIVHCNIKKYELFIVSHKTRFGHYDKKKFSLRDEALQWMQSQNIIGKNLDNIKKENIFFFSTRKKKIQFIKKLKLNFFIDDLSEVLLDKNFPKNTKKILLSENFHKNLICAQNWFHIDKIINKKWSNQNIKKLSCFLLSTRNITDVKKIYSGINSQVYRFNNLKKKIVLKIYPSKDKQLLKRIQTEVKALIFLNKKKLLVPKIYQCFDDFNCCFFLFCEGKKNFRINSHLIDQACSFIKKLFKLSKEKKIPLFLNAKEACFSPSQICLQIEKKLNFLLNIKKKKLNIFLIKKFKKFYDKNKQRSILELNSQFNKKIKSSNKILSPSDFGFHNTILNKDELYFIDFEYFGWDDSIKLICDFYWHPGNKINKTLKIYFLNKMIKFFSKKYKNFEKRLNILLPLYGLRWILIMLNCFTQPNLNNRIIQLEQLKQAENLLDRIISNGR